MSSSKRPDLVIYNCERPGLREPAITGLKPKQNKNLSYQIRTCSSHDCQSQTSVPISAILSIHSKLYLIMCAVEIYLTSPSRKAKIPNHCLIFFECSDIRERERNICALMNGKSGSVPLSVKTETFVFTTHSNTKTQNSTNLVGFR